MIRVMLHRRGDTLTGFECRGHAGYAEAGKDIVCAAVSVLTTTCANALESVAGVKPLVRADGGRMLLALPHGAGRDAQVILAAMAQGLRDVAAQYPRHLQLTEITIIGGSKHVEA